MNFNNYCYLIICSSSISLEMLGWRCIIDNIRNIWQSSDWHYCKLISCHLQDKIAVHVLQLKHFYRYYLKWTCFLCWYYCVGIQIRRQKQAFLKFINNMSTNVLISIELFHKVPTQQSLLQRSGWYWGIVTLSGRNLGQKGEKFFFWSFLKVFYLCMFLYEIKLQCSIP